MAAIVVGRREYHCLERLELGKCLVAPVRGKLGRQVGVVLLSDGPHASIRQLADDHFLCLREDVYRQDTPDDEPRQVQRTFNERSEWSGVAITGPRRVCTENV